MKLKKGRIETIETLEITETQTKLTRSGISLKNFTPTCFLYDKDDNDKWYETAHASNFKFNERLKKLHKRSETQKFLQSLGQVIWLP